MAHRKDNHALHHARNHASTLDDYLFCGALLGLLVDVSHAADELDKLLLQHSRTILPTLKDRGYKNVGVLKFRVKKGDEPATDRAGTLNLRLAEKLEMALILANKIQDRSGSYATPIELPPRFQVPTT